jgi:glucose-6-phosphate dehydrogenase assembly protein OpcA
MALKVLGQQAPSASTATTLYTVPASTETVVSSLTVANRGSSSATFRVAVRPAGASLANEHYIYHGITIPGGDAFAATLGITLATTDVVTVWASSADLSFGLFGEEVAT